MPRRPRAASGNYVYHVLNRAVGRSQIFGTDEDYWAFLKVIEQARDKAECRLLAFCVMPNHWHLVLWPKGDDDLSEYMRQGGTGIKGATDCSKCGTGSPAFCDVNSLHAQHEKLLTKFVFSLSSYPASLRS